MRVLNAEYALTESRFVRLFEPAMAEALRAHCQVGEYEQGGVVCRAGDVVPGPCFLERGLVAYYCTDD